MSSEFDEGPSTICPYEVAINGITKRKSKPMTLVQAANSLEENGQPMPSSTDDVESAISNDRLSKKDISEMVIPTNVSSHELRYS